MSGTIHIKYHAGIKLPAELLLTALVVASLLWWIQAELASLHTSARWAEARIASGQAAETDREKLTTAFRAAYSWQDAAGNLSAYPLSRDSYYFMRLARNIVETGTPCPANPSNTSCHDTQVNPPDGRPMNGAHSPHPWAIALVYKTLQLVEIEPSMLHAGRLHNRLMLVLCGLLAFLLLRNLLPDAYRIGGLAAAITLVLVPAVMQRSFGVDNDVWILTLLMTGTLAASHFLKSAVTGNWHWLSLVITGLACVLLYATWGGWPFLLILLGTAAIVAFVESLRRNKGGYRQKAYMFGTIIFALIILFILAAVLAPDWLTDDTATVLETSSEPPPDAFAAVAELAPLDLPRILEGFGWPVLLAVIIGLAEALRRLWPWTSNDFPATSLLLLAWTVGALILALRAERFILLLAPPLAILAGLGITAVSTMLPRPKLQPVIATGLGLALLAYITTHALFMARDNRPQLNTAWVSVLNDLAQTTPANAILLGWWNTGHWATYWAQRTVAVDGASLRDLRIHDMGRLFTNANPETAGNLVNQAACKQSTGCNRPVYLLTSDELLGDLSWMISGFWQTERASLVDQLTAGKQPADVPAKLLAEARSIDTPLERSLFSAPDARLWSTNWTTCTVKSDNSYDCPLNITSENGWLIERLVVPGGEIGQARLVVRGHTTREPIVLAPSLLRLATPERLIDVVHDAQSNNPGVLLDTAQQRAFLGTQAMLRSLVARLVLLDGRYDTARFSRVASASTVDGHWVSAWRVLRQ